MKPVNYNCPVCKKSGKIPNIKGKFHIISNSMCKCNGCDSIFEKNNFYKAIVSNATLYTE
jgi:hypothetical protein